ncbi:MAG: Holliday junction resolvase RuvX [Actinomycetota bacterium]|nr:Holliday junction resolvase RuvX [Actinomycetota bacterium]
MPGVHLAFDVGTARIGVARSDPAGILATPLAAIAAGPGAIGELGVLIAEYEVVDVVIGLPLNMNGTAGPAAESARAWANLVAQAVDVPVRLVDERLTTVQAQRGLHEAGRTVRSSRAVIDSAAAVVLLQSYLDAQRKAGQ